MNVKKAVLVAGVVTGVGLAGIAGLGVASAATDTSSTKSSIIDKIATKFNLDKDEVTAVFEEERAEKQAKHQQHLEERLTQAVEDGKITAEQKDKILAKLTELKAEMESNREVMKDKTVDELRTMKETQREELEQWAKDNNVPLRYLHFGFGHPGHGPHGPKGERPFDAANEQ